MTPCIHLRHTSWLCVWATPPIQPCVVLALTLFFYFHTNGILLKYSPMWIMNITIRNTKKKDFNEHFCITCKALPLSHLQQVTFTCAIVFVHTCVPHRRCYIEFSPQVMCALMFDVYLYFDLTWPKHSPFQVIHSKVGVRRKDYCTVYTRYRHTHSGYNLVTGTNISYTNLPPPNRLQYRH